MLRKYFDLFWQKLRKAFSTEETRFLMMVGLKVSGISLLVTFFIYYFLYQILKLNHAFFKAHGFPDLADDSAFFEYITQEAVYSLPVLFLFHNCLFFIGVYVAWLVMRPFRNLGNYCEEVVGNPNAIYLVDEFGSYKLLGRFSEFFFTYLTDARKKGVLQSNVIPPQFAKVHKPVPDRIFMLHFGLMLIIIVISSSVFIIENSSSVFLHMADLAQETLPNTKALNKYFIEQSFILDEIIVLTIVLTSVSYLALGLHIYNQVSGAAFGIFSTMRAFMKGNYYSRVHLVGFNHVRDHSRKFNKYLDYMENNFSKSKSEG